MRANGDRNSSPSKVLSKVFIATLLIVPLVVARPAQAVSTPVTAVYLSFVPAAIVASPGDVIEFWASGGHSFSTYPGFTDFPSRYAVRPSKICAGPNGRDYCSVWSNIPLLSLKPSLIRIAPDAPPGVYQFFCDPHLGYGMIGYITITP